MFDPAYPPANAEVESAPLRSQFNSLKDLIDAIVSVTGAQVQSTTTLNPGLSATASVVLDGSVLRFTFGIPRGATGVQGPPFADIIVDSVSTLDPSEPAYVNVSFDGTNLHFDIGIPRGHDGADGVDGVNGEVTQSALDDAIAGTSANSNAVDFLSLTVSDPPTESEVQSLVDKVNELIGALRR